MKIILALLLLTVAAHAAPAKPIIKNGMVMRTIQADAELKDWIIGIQNLAQQSQAEADAAEVAAKDSRAQAAIAQDQLVTVQHQFDAERAAKIKAEQEREQERLAKEAEKKLRLAAEAHVRKIKNWLSIALAIVFVLAVQYLPFGLLTPPFSIYARIAASLAAAGAAWTIVALIV